MTLTFEPVKTDNPTLYDIIATLDNRQPLQRLINARNEASDAAWLAEALTPLIDEQTAEIAEIEQRLSAAQAEADDAQAKNDEAQTAFEVAGPFDSELGVTRRKTSLEAQRLGNVVVSIFRNLKEANAKLQTMAALAEDLRQITPGDIADARRLLAAEFR